MPFGEEAVRMCFENVEENFEFLDGDYRVVVEFVSRYDGQPWRSIVAFVTSIHFRIPTF